MRAEVINKIIITTEAIFDYENCIGKRSQPLWWDLLAVANNDKKKAFKIAEWFDQPLRKLDKAAIKGEVEEYINNLNRSGRLLYERYFRCYYYDEKIDRMLMLFLYRADKVSVMQNWQLAGICLAKGWDEDAEHEGKIRAWVETKITDLPDEEDWAVRHRVNQILKYTEKTLFENVLKEVQDAFKCERDKETAKGLALLQSVHFEFRERKRPKSKTRKDRKSGKQP